MHIHNHHLLAVLHSRVRLLISNSSKKKKKTSIQVTARPLSTSQSARSSVVTSPWRLRQALGNRCDFATFQAADTALATKTETAAELTPEPKPEAPPTGLEEEEEEEEEEVAEEECVSALKLVGGQCNRGKRCEMILT